MTEPAASQDRVEALRRRLWLGQAGPSRDGSGPADGADAWAGTLADGAGDPVGVAFGEVPAAWREPLARAGVPMAKDGDLSWNLVVEDPTAVLPRQERDRLILPPVERFAGLTSLPLREVRRWVHHHLGLRLQVATGVQVFLWQHRYVLVNHTEHPRHGFAYGPATGLRAALQLDPGGWYEASW